MTVRDGDKGGANLTVLLGGQARSSRLAIMDQAAAPAERADAARNRQRILDAARKLLGRRPINEICMDELAAAAGVGKGTLYRRFTDRASLCHALLDDNEKLLQARVLRGFDLPHFTPPLDRLATLLEALFDFAQENAQLLAEALAFHRGQDNRFLSPPQQWRVHEISRQLQAMRTPGEPLVLAQLILCSLDPELILFHRSQGVPEQVQKDAFSRLWRTGVTQAATIAP